MPCKIPVAALCAVVLVLVAGHTGLVRGQVYCNTGERRCPADDTCIDSSQVCDGVNDCSDGFDEPEGRCCSYFGFPGFLCPDDDCIYSGWLCDRDFDCRPWVDDEQYCGYSTFLSSGCDATVGYGSNTHTSTFTCDNFDCIDGTYECDNIWDCPDYSDESDCGDGCGTGELTCGSQCFPESFECDGTYHCDDLSDESPPELCICGDLDNSYICQDGSGLNCIDKDRRCDETQDCSDGSDEKPFLSDEYCLALTGMCYSNEFKCVSEDVCIPTANVCDEVPDCTDASDERSASSGNPDCPCPSTLSFECSDNTCIQQSLTCDGMYDCSDGSDEQSCTCTTAQFACASGGCILDTAACDDTPNCHDGSDEAPVMCVVCEEDEFRCDTTYNCISSTLACDYIRNCNDGSDELPLNSDCGACDAAHEYQCSDSSCIAHEMLCDGIQHCPDGSDEDDILCASPECVSRQFPCHTEGECIDLDVLCDGDHHCSDNSDEIYCSRCNATHQFYCGADAPDCVPTSVLCDGKSDCSNDADEFCTGCASGDFECDPSIGLTSTCINDTLVCDHSPDCPITQNDEEGCCPDGQFFCLNDNCVPEDYRCDGYNDCGDGSDEQDCSSAPCSDGEYDFVEWTTYFAEDAGLQNYIAVVRQCLDRLWHTACLDEWSADGDTLCELSSRDPAAFESSVVSVQDSRLPESNNAVEDVLSRAECCFGIGNRSIECTGGPSVIWCSELCASEDGRFECGNGRCVLEVSRCDGDNDCGDGTDEQNCLDYQCPVGRFQCVSDGLCISDEFRCDGVLRCADESDEHNCDTHVCNEQQFNCTDGSCIALGFMCDGRSDCVDHSDELGCGGCASEDLFACTAHGQCISQHFRCDGSPDCLDGSDELGCDPQPPACDTTSGLFECDAGTKCLMETVHLCDGVEDCEDGTDEPPSCPAAECQASEFACHDNRTCIPLYWECDGFAQCSDSSDEDDSLCHPNRPCNEYQWACNSGVCIPAFRECDSAVDCADGSDEDIHCVPCNERDPPQRSCDDGQCIGGEQFCDFTTDCDDGSDENVLQCNYFGCSSDMENQVTLYQRTDWYVEDRHHFQGRVEVCSAGELRDVCPDTWDSDDAQVICLQFGGYQYVGRTLTPDDADFGPSSGTYVLSTVNCTGSESMFSECFADFEDSIGNVSCSSSPSYPAAVLCTAVCKSSESTCVTDLQCIASERWCDGIIDCSDESDELDCGNSSIVPCGSGRTRCPGGSTVCISDVLVCDGITDCPDGSDENEELCACSEDEFECTISGECVPTTSVCDGDDDCSDGTDEGDCGTVTECTEEGTMRLVNIASGISDSNRRFIGGRVEVCYDGHYGSVCDRSWDMADATVACKTYRDQSTTANTTLLSATPVYASVYGDGPEPVVDAVGCIGTEDSLSQCSPIESGEFGPDTVSTVCKEGARSAGVVCSQVCLSDQFNCQNDRCISESLVCNGMDNCGDGSDEVDCPECPVDQYTCSSSGRCIATSLVCDGNPDCVDGSDEINCMNGSSNPTPTEKPSGPPLNFRVSSSECQSLDLYWEPPALNDRNGVITAYRVTCRPDQFLDQPWTFETSGAHVITGVLPGTAYTCTVEAANDLGFGPPTQGSASTQECSDCLPFVVLGLTTGVAKTCLNDGDDVSSGAIGILPGIPLGNRIQTVAYVGTNGIISFGAPFQHWSPNPFPTTDYWTRTSYVVAPYWSDVDTRMEGTVCYEYHEADLIEDTTTIDRVSTFIRENTGTDFSGLWMLVAEWNSVHPYPHGVANTATDLSPGYEEFLQLENTFQAVVITDGLTSYSLFIYPHGGINWAGHVSLATIGYNFNGDYYLNHPLSNTEQVSTVDDSAVDNPSGCVFANILLLLSQSEDEVAELRVDCLKRYDSDLDRYGSDIRSYTDQGTLLPCPCTARQAWLDGRYIPGLTVDNCFYQRFPSLSGSAQYCCYSTDGALLTEPWTLTSSSLFLYHPDWYHSQFTEEDWAFRQTCCGVVGLCSLYFRRRPVDTCEDYIPPVFTFGFGDPHITTTDQKTYTFNGWGEYILLETEDDSFALQGRTHLVGGATATQFNAFAFGIPSQNVTIQVDYRNDEFVVLYNGGDVSSAVSQTSNSYRTSVVHITRTSNSTISAAFTNHVTITVRVQQLILDFRLNLPDSFQGKTRGLLGNFNGNPNDDYAYADGSGRFLNPAASDKEVHLWAQQWQVDGNSSLFSYFSGLTWSDYHHPSHQPTYLADTVSNASQAVIDMCGGNVRCIYDATQTGSNDIGMTTLDTEMTTLDEQAQTMNSPPVLSGTNTFRVALGIASTYTFQATDTNNFVVSISGGLPAGASLSGTGNGQYSFTWELGSVAAARAIQFVASDDLGAMSMLIPVVEVCACQNNGLCVFEGIYTELAILPQGDHVVMNCICTEAWAGEYCEEDRNGCATHECAAGVECFDNAAPLTGATCGPCAGGFAGDDKKCFDIDECSSGGSSTCAQICTNTPGSYECSCLDGYQPMDGFPELCEDIDECALATHGCHHGCNNTVGSFHCTCRDLFELDNDGRTCIVPASFQCSANQCAQLCVSRPMTTSFECDCEPGYVLLQDGFNCTDIDECELQTSGCEQDCINTNGSYYCECPLPGYSLGSDGHSCNDINECANLSICDAFKFCVNTPGGYRCECPPGTEEDAGGQCTAVTIPEPTRGPEPSTTSTAVDVYVTPTESPTEHVNPSFRITVTTQALNLTEFEVKEDTYKMLVADAVTTYCARVPDQCTGWDIMTEMEVAGDSWVVQPSNVLVINKNQTEDGHATFEVLVLLDSRQHALAVIPLTDALEESADTFGDFDHVVDTPGSDEKEDEGLDLTIIIAAAVGGAVAIIIVLMIILIVIICCVRSRRNKLAPYSQHRGSDQTSSGYPTIQSGDSKMSIASEDIFNRPASRQFMNPLFSMDNEEDDNIGYDAAEDFDYIANEKALEAAAEN